MNPHLDLRVAYGCFLFYGLSWLTIGTGIAVLTTLPPNEGLAALLGIGIAAPLILASFVALLVGIVAGLFLSQGEWPLFVVSALSLMIPIAIFREYVGQNGATALAISGGLIITLIAGRGLWRNM
jgi:hypothetical protein